MLHQFFPKSKCLRNVSSASSILRHILFKQSHHESNFVAVGRRKLHLSGSLQKPKVVRIGCASGFWGDTPTASAQLVNDGDLDFLIYDYLSEITMSLLTAAQARNPQMGYAPDFVQDAVGPLLGEIKKKGVKVISNAGGMNPRGCAEALAQVAKKKGVELKIGVVTGDNLMPVAGEFVGVPDMASGQPLPDAVHSMNAYLGSGPIVMCLEMGADVIITGRCVDSALALAPLVHTFGWAWSDLDLLASGSLAGHLLECGAQATGGICTDWRHVPGWHHMGFPIAEVSEDGATCISKPPQTGGHVTPGTVAEQLLYEIGDPRAYVLPDVVCDFSGVRVQPAPGGGVEVWGARGRTPTEDLKVCATYLDGFKATAVCCVGGPGTPEKGRRVGDALLRRTRGLLALRGLPDFTRTHVQVLGAEDTYGPHAKGGEGPRDGVLWVSVHHGDRKAVEVFSREVASAGTGMSPGLTSVVGGRPKPTPVLRLHSFLVKKARVGVQAEVGDRREEVVPPAGRGTVPSAAYRLPDQPSTPVQNLKRGDKVYRLEDLALTRSGDKGNSCNVGVVARREALLPYLQEALTKEAVAAYFAHLFPPEEGDPARYVKRFEVPGVRGLNFVLEESLGGGGVASLRSDPQGKALGQMLLDFRIHDMPDIDSI